MSPGVTSLHVFSVPAPMGRGGLGRHGSELMAFVRADGCSTRYFAFELLGSNHVGEAVPLNWLSLVFRFTPARFSPAWKIFLASWTFDRVVAARLPRGSTLTAFGGAALNSFRRARELGYREIHLESGSAHVGYASRMYALARRRHPVEHDWLGSRLLDRTLAEYELADVIWVNSEYARQTFLAEGVPAGKLRRRWLTVEPRFKPPLRRARGAGLHVVYVGSINVSKGVPLLVEAFARYSDPQARLTLIGATGTRGMADWIKRACARDPRLRLSPGDPLPHLQAADLCVHPSYSDGFGYGPAEALACGLPVVVTEDTGMREQVKHGENGFVVPTGSADAILDRLVFYGRCNRGATGDHRL